MDSPEDVVRLFLGHCQAGEWDHAAELIDSESLSAWFSPYHAQPEPSPHFVSAWDMRVGDSEMPDAVAEYLAARHNRQAKAMLDSTAWQFARVSSRRELDELSPLKAMARYLEALSPGYQFDLMIQTQSIAVAATDSAGLQRHMPLVRRRAVGSVLDGPQKAHVVLVESIGGQDLEEPESGTFVATLVKTDQGWRIMPAGRLFAQIGWSLGFDPPPDEDGAARGGVSDG